MLSVEALSLLVALVAVLGATVPVLIESLESDDAVVNVTPLDVEYVRSRQGEQLVIVASTYSVHRLTALVTTTCIMGRCL